MFFLLKKFAEFVAYTTPSVFMRIFEAMFLHVTRVHGDEAETKAIRRQMIPLEELERTLAARYGMVEDIDSVEVFDEAKSRAFAKCGPHFEEDLQALDRLNKLRLLLTRRRHSRAVCPPAKVSVSSMSHETFYSPLP